MPCNASWKLPVEALGGITNDTCAELLALIVTGQEGEQAVPAGSPLIATETDPEKPFDPATEIVTGALVVPICVLTDAGDTLREKSGERTVNRMPLLACPPTITTTLPVVAPPGTVTVMLVVLHALAVPAEDPLKLTVLPA